MTGRHDNGQSCVCVCVCVCVRERESGEALTRTESTAYRTRSGGKPVITITDLRPGTEIEVVPLFADN